MASLILRFRALRVRARQSARPLWLVLLIGLLATHAPTHSRPVNAAAPFTTITVTTTADEDGTNPAKCSLREAIKAANTNSSYGGCPGGVVFAPDSIVFNLGFGAVTINLASELPAITGPVLIDGATGTSTSITLNGASAGAGAIGLNFDGFPGSANQGSSVSALTIRNFDTYGIRINSTSGITVSNCVISNNQIGIHVPGADGNFIGTGSGTGNTIVSNRDNGITIFGSNNIVKGNFIGTDASGTPGLGNSQAGIFIGDGQQNQIGGSTAGAGNVISGNVRDGITIQPSPTAAVTGTSIKGNLIGTNPAGTAALGNTFSGIAIIGATANGNLIGGTEAGARNVISGNGTQGIYLNAPSNTLQGNYIGTKADGVSALANGANGVQISGVSNNTIGGTAAGAGNLISGNTLDGINISGSVTGTFIEGNLIGLKADGLSELANGVSGVAIIGANATGNLIGGSEAGARNVISGNGTRGVYLNAPSNSVWGNYIGPNADGLTAPVLNQNDGVVIESSGVQTVNAINNRIGGIGPGYRNLISGNGFSGITIKDAASSGNRVDANYIGTNINGTAAIAGTLIGVLINGAPANTIGSLNRSEGNLISGNLEVGVTIYGNTASNNEVVGNYIGTTANGTAAIPIVGINSRGISITSGAQNNLIGSSVFGAGNIISGHAKDGIVLGSDNNRIEGNYIGTDVTGMAAIPNGNNGIYISNNASSNAIGGSGSRLRNIISGNSQNGIRVESGSNNQIYGNFIGLKSDGISALGNTLDGIFINTQLTYVGNTGGADNTIAFNGRNGVTVTGNDGASGNFITVNSIHSNGALGIDLAPLDAMNNPVFGVTPNDTGDSDAGPNHLANYPVLTSAVGYSAGANTIVRIKGTLNTTPNNMGRVLFFLSPNCDPSGFGEGKTYLGDSGFVTANASGNLSLDVTLTGLPISFNAGDSVTALYLWSNNSASEFSACIPLLAPQLAINDFSVTEGNSGTTPANFTVTLTGAIGVADPITVNYATASGTATAGGDYVVTNGTLTFNPPFTQNTITQTLTVQLIGDTTLEANETFIVNLTANVNATLTDNQGQVTILDDDCPAITLTPPPLPNGQLSQFYSQQLTQTGGVAPVTWSLSSGSLPNNLTLNPSTGLLSGTPIVAGSFPFTVKVTDANGCLGTQNYTLVISSCPSITVNPPTLPASTSFSFYNQTISASGGALPYNFTVSSGALPAGLSLNPTTGVLSGAPTIMGTFSFTVRATDLNACFGERPYSLTITPNPGLMFYPLPRPVRLLDTRAGQGSCDSVGTPIAAGTSITTQARINCEGIPIPANAQAVAGNITVLNQSSEAGYLTLYPTGVSAPLAANIIYYPGQILSNAFTVGLSASGAFDIFGQRTIHIVVDISGYYAPPGAGGLYFHPLPRPLRLLDTRAGQGNCDTVGAPIAAGTSLTTQGRLNCESLTIPAAAQALVGNATVINLSSEAGYLTLYPNGVGAPVAANLIYYPGQLLSNNFTVSLSASGAFNSFAQRTLDLIVDVAGYYSAEVSDVNGPGLLFNALARPVRLLDTRAGQGNCDSINAPIAAGTSLTTQARSTCEGLTIPNTAQTVLGNVTVINLTGETGYLTLYPNGVGAPLAANLIYYPGQVLSNAFVVGLSGAGEFNIFAQRMIEAIVDVSGYFAP